MKIAVLSDIHGNEAALDACLAHAAAQSAERYLFLGDYAGELPWPERVMDRLYALRAQFPCVFIRGNKEDYWLNADPAWRAGDSTTGMLWYNMRQLRPEDLDFYRTLPMRDAWLDLTLCHGTPERSNGKMLPGEEDTFALMARDPNPVILCGHSHHQAAILHGGRQALNPGSVGVPLGCGGKAQYLLLEGAPGSWQRRFFSLAYDAEGEIEAMRAAGLFHIAPAWSRITAHVLRGGAASHAQALARAMEICRRQNGSCVWPRIPEDCWRQAMAELGIAN